MPALIDRQFIFRYAGLRHVEQSRVAKLGNAGCLPGMGDFSVSLGACGVEDDVIGPNRAWHQRDETGGDAEG